MQINNLHISEATVRIEGGRVYAEAELTPEIESQLPKKWEPWRPENKGFYFVLGERGRFEEWQRDESEAVDIDLHEFYTIGNCFPTREIAELTAKVEKLNRRLLPAAAVLEPLTVEYREIMIERNEAERAATEAWRAFYKQEATT